MKRGWFKVPGLRPEGDRSIEEQLLGLERALAECRGKTVLDLGCAEGCIAAEFARAGAAHVLGIELLDSHLAIARDVCRGLPVNFLCAHLGDYIRRNPEPLKFDIVLALGIIHKLEDPNVPLRWAAGAARSLLCFRAPAKVERLGEDYMVKSKHTGTPCNVQQVMRKAGFADEGIIKGARGEGVQYFRRQA